MSSEHYFPSTVVWEENKVLNRQTWHICTSDFKTKAVAMQLYSGDYRLPQRFLDTTKANLFFAGSVMRVNGDAENILLPQLHGSLAGLSLNRLFHPCQPQNRDYVKTVLKLKIDMSRSRF